MQNDFCFQDFVHRHVTSYCWFSVGTWLISEKSRIYGTELGEDCKRFQVLALEDALHEVESERAPLTKYCIELKLGNRYGCAWVCVQFRTSRGWLMFIVLRGRCPCQGWTIHLQAVHKTKKGWLRASLWIPIHYHFMLDSNITDHYSIFYSMSHVGAWHRGARG